LTLFREPIKIVCIASHPLARSSFLTFDQLQNEPVVWLSRAVNPAFYDGVMSLCISQAYRPKIVQEVRSFFES
jgi:DNA-binding transcriptional LysR family regulator